MFIPLLIGDEVHCRWIAARIPVRVLGVSGWPFSDLTSALNFRRNSFSSTSVTQLKSTVSFRSSHHFLNFLIPHEVALFVFSAWHFASNLSKSSSPKSEFWMLISSITSVFARRRFDDWKKCSSKPEFRKWMVVDGCDVVSKNSGSDVTNWLDLRNRWPSIQLATNRKHDKSN